MSAAAYVLVGTTLSVLATIATTLWRSRRSGPETQSTLIGAGDLLISQLAARVEVLERKVNKLEAENDAYHRLFGPLPPEHQPPPTGGNPS